MPEKTQADVDVRIAEIRQLTKKLEKLRLAGGSEQCKLAEKLATAIQEQAASIRIEIRKLLE